MEDLKNTVIQTLESNGILGKLRAQLRSSVFSVIENQDNNTKAGVGFQWENPLAPKIVETTEGQLCTDLIREFLEFYRMDYTLSTFLPECSLCHEPNSRSEIEAKVGLPPADTSIPLLMHLILSFMKGITTNLKEEEMKKPEPVVNTTETPMPSGLLPADDKKEEIKSSMLTVEDDVKATPVMPVEQAPKSPPKPDPLSKLDKIPAKKRGLEPLDKKSPDNTSAKSNGLSSLTSEPEKKHIADVDKQLKDLQDNKGMMAQIEKKPSDISEDYVDDFDEEEIDEDLPVNFDESDDKFGEEPKESASQSIGMDPSVTSLDIEGYDFIEKVQLYDE